jgi:hypothetical protein
MKLHRAKDAYPYVSNIGYHNGIINLITSVKHVEEVKVNGLPMTEALKEEIAEALALQFRHHGDTYTFED